ncbi:MULTISPECIES: preprotein translocase subunit SecD [unclassified Bordetella]|uniref:SecDF P1 head subdomain-containing protein n=1 Tax=unclassified Bordetella TaxID=2630031 RepID=UPI0013225778|nr:MULTISPECIES: preprotein translocase subunit SecD [unclassified Bordetella]MVW71461.1 preprotein translocase subunit SecD [Bordetella sp. 15P40C-2]MVW79322.1 preprotein translocase subunit SecD [Bordetella sp. 02P26C-1]
MQFTMRKLAPAVAVLTFALAGCQTSPKQTAKTDEAAQSTQAQGQAVTASSVEFYVARTASAPGLMEIKVPDGSLFLERQPALTRADLSEAAALVDRDGQNYVGLRFTEGGARKLNDVSNQNVGNMLALVIDRELVAAPRIAETLNRGVLAFGVPSAQAASEIAAKIRGDQASAAQPNGSSAPNVPNPASPTAPAPLTPR